jgi:hypothetical protein
LDRRETLSQSTSNESRDITTTKMVPILRQLPQLVMWPHSSHTLLEETLNPR